jgi:hypothetical protein
MLFTYRYSLALCGVLAATLFSSNIAGCSGGQEPTENPATTTASPTTEVPVASPMQPVNPSTRGCPGNTLGTYTVDKRLWQDNNMELIDFLSSDVAKEWQCGDVYLNVADFSSAGEIVNPNDLTKFIVNLRTGAENSDGVVWIVYSDLVDGSPVKMLEFVDKFYGWASAIPSEDIQLLGTIGLSFDVLNVDPETAQDVLQKSQIMKSVTSIPRGQLLVQFALEASLDQSATTDKIMRYADSALMPLYRNTVQDGLASITDRLAWMLHQQCTGCLDDEYAIANFNAQITILVEASCTVTSNCAETSFCAYDAVAPNGGAEYIFNTLLDMEKNAVRDSVLSQEQLERLLHPVSKYAVHAWQWYRCFTPFSDSLSYSDCEDYHHLAQQCRGEGN